MGSRAEDRPSVLSLNREDQQRSRPALVAAVSSLARRYARVNGTYARRLRGDSNEYMVAARGKMEISTKPRTCRTPGARRRAICMPSQLQNSRMMRNYRTKASAVVQVREPQAFVTVLAAVWAESSRRHRISRLSNCLCHDGSSVSLTVKQASLGYPVRLPDWSHFGSIPGSHRALYRDSKRVFVAPGFAPNLPLHAGSLVEVSG